MTDLFIIVTYQLAIDTICKKYKFDTSALIVAFHDLIGLCETHSQQISPVFVGNNKNVKTRLY